MTHDGFARLLAAALPEVSAERLRPVAELCWRYAAAQADVGPLAAEARRLAPPPLTGPGDETPLPDTERTGPRR